MNPLPDLALFAPRTIFGRGRSRDLPALVRPWGDRGFLLCGSSFRNSPGAADRLAALGPGCLVVVHPGGEPTLDQAESIRDQARRHGAAWMAGVGGGSVLDLAKAAAGLFHEAGTVAAVHAGQPVQRAGIPFVAVPTTAGTGAEATPNAVLTDGRTDLKKSIRDDRFMAAAVILDSGLLAGSPAAVIAHAGMDAYTQALEAGTSRKSTDWSEATARTAIRLIASSLPAVQADPACGEADSLMAGSYLAGVALAQARLGVVHGLAHPLGAFYHQPHGLVCAACLTAALELNRPDMGPAYDRFSQAVGGDLAGVTADLIARLGIRNPFKGQPLIRLPEIVEQTLSSGSTQANPKTIGKAEIDWLLARLFRP
jgi:alcohol dehydrogenase class IV